MLWKAVSTDKHVLLSVLTYFKIPYSLILADSYWKFPGHLYKRQPQMCCLTLRPLATLFTSTCLGPFTTVFLFLWLWSWWVGLSGRALNITVLSKLLSLWKPFSLSSLSVAAYLRLVILSFHILRISLLDCSIGIIIPSQGLSGLSVSDFCMPCSVLFCFCFFFHHLLMYLFMESWGFWSERNSSSEQMSLLNKEANVVTLTGLTQHII